MFWKKNYHQNFEYQSSQKKVHPAQIMLETFWFLLISLLSGYSFPYEHLCIKSNSTESAILICPNRWISRNSKTWESKKALIRCPHSKCIKVANCWVKTWAHTWGISKASSWEIRQSLKWKWEFWLLGIQFFTSKRLQPTSLSLSNSVPSLVEFAKILHQFTLGSWKNILQHNSLRF